MDLLRAANGVASGSETPFGQNQHHSQATPPDNFAASLLNGSSDVVGGFLGGGGGGSGAIQQAASSASSSAAAVAAAAAASSSSTNLLGLNLDNGPILYMEPNRTSAIEDIRSVIIYISFATLLFGFLIIFPGIRHDKIPTFIVIPTSLVVTCIIFVALTGSSWHVGEAPISAAYKAFSRDRIQGDLTVRIGLQSVNITLSAHKHYILHSSQGPMIMMTMEDKTNQEEAVITPSRSQTTTINNEPITTTSAPTNEATENPFTTQSALLSEVESSDQDEPTFAASGVGSGAGSDVPSPTINSRSLVAGAGEARQRTARQSTTGNQFKKQANNNKTTNRNVVTSTSRSNKNQQQTKEEAASLTSDVTTTSNSNNNNDNNNNNSEFIRIKGQNYRIERINVDINYNERFYWIEPNQMRQEYHGALKRGLPYPILTVVEYLSQDEAGFSWSRQYRLAGYYSYILLCITLSCCALMFLFHCAAPIYAIYTLQLIGCLLLLTNLTYSMLIPRGDQSLVIPFEGQNLTFQFGFQFWLVLFGGCLALVIGSALAIINQFWPLTTILDHDFDTHGGYYRHRKRKEAAAANGKLLNLQRPIKPPPNLIKTISSSSSISSNAAQMTDVDEDEEENINDVNQHLNHKKNSSDISMSATSGETSMINNKVQQPEAKQTRRKTSKSSNSDAKIQQDNLLEYEAEYSTPTMVSQQQPAQFYSTPDSKKGPSSTTHL